MFAHISQTRTFQIIDGAGDPIDLSSLTGNVTWTATGANGAYTIGPKTAIIENATKGICSVNLTALELAHPDTYNVTVNIGAPINRVSYVESITLEQLPAVNSVAVVANQQFDLDFTLKNSDNSVIDLTTITAPVFYTKAQQNITGTPAGTVTILDAPNGKVRVTHTLTSDVWGYFIVDTIVTSDIKISVQ